VYLPLVPHLHHLHHHLQLQLNKVELKLEELLRVLLLKEKLYNFLKLFLEILYNPLLHLLLMKW
tara:strand:- start:75 stop:266 length:192 start_codon:yes stop_codon:yes gene_type:complete